MADSQSPSIQKTDSMPVPMLDVKRQNRPLEVEISTAIAAVIESGAFVHGPACKEFESSISEYCGTKHAIGCASGSDALLLALMVLGIGPGDEVILPSFTFFATAGAVWRLGAKPVFVDIQPDTFNIDPKDVARKINKSTKAILPVHLFGQCSEMQKLTEIAGEIPVIEDAAQAIGAEFGGKRSGSLGTLGCFSFYPTKNLGGFGDGGIITTDDDQLAKDLRVLRDHGQEPRYYHSIVGVNSRLDAVQAAVLNVKLKCLDKWAEGRQQNAERYESEFRRLGIDHFLGIPEVADKCNSVWNQYTVRVPAEHRNQLQEFLGSRQIGSAIYYPVPLHKQQCFSELGYQSGSLPETEKASEEVLSLPIFAELTTEEQNLVISSLAEFYGIEYSVDISAQAA